MATINQLANHYPRRRKKTKVRSTALEKSPQKKGIVNKVVERKPKKPNSAKRKVAKVKLSSGRSINVHIPGEGHNLQPHSIVLVRGGRANDLPGVKYRIIRGKYDCDPVSGRKSSPSKYGVKTKN
uniref:Ribosomal protein S12, mitochondrial n=1 Tax=Pharyngomonas kirbyi TaxID=63601 RepID=A0A1W6R287_9EUKA|nr:ribosomal protein S12 [Pharyngomonas kirbyi]ARO48011.1 ribosomal protein S12 [Pharyngomonas kirbyi]